MELGLGVVLNPDEDTLSNTSFTQRRIANQS